MGRKTTLRELGQGIFAATLVCFVASTVVSAQSLPRTYRIGWLGHGDRPTDTSRSSGEFQQALREAGYVEGTNLAIVYRYAEGNVSRLPELATELMRERVDVIVTSGEPAALAAKRATGTIPIVATEIAFDPVKAGLVASLNRPGANVTGLAMQGVGTELWQKRFDLLRQIVPSVSRLAVLWNPNNPGNAACVEDIKAAATSIAMQPRFLEVGEAAAVDRALAAVAGERTDAFVMCWDSVILAQARRIADFASRHRLPTVAPLREYVVAGSLIALGTSLESQRRRAAYYVDRLLKGAKPADLPVEQLTQLLFVNQTTSSSLGLQLPPALLLFMEEPIR